MDEAEKKFFADLRDLGVKVATCAIDNFGVRRVTHVEFFEHAPAFARFDADTLIPPASEDEQSVAEARAAKVPPALSRLLKNGSVS